MTEIVEVDPDFLFDHIAGLRHVVSGYEPRDEEPEGSFYPVLACGHDLYAGPDINWCVPEKGLDLDRRHQLVHAMGTDCPICFAEPT